MDMEEVLNNANHEEESMTLQIKMSERKATVKRAAEERRQEDLRRIQSLNSRNSGGIHPLNIFPKEVWDIILEFLRDHEDLDNARKACKLFENLLEKRRFMDILLPKLLNIDEFRRSLWDRSVEIPVLTRQDDFYAERNETTWDWNLNIKLRSLSKSFRDKVDLNLEKGLEQGSVHQFELDGNAYCHRKTVGLDFSPGICMRLNLLGVEYKEPFYSFMKDVDPVQTPVPAKRFVGKHLRVYFVGPMDYRKHMKEVTSFMDLVGDQILLFEPHIRISELMGPFGIGLSTIEAYNFLREWAQRTPNLKWLYLTLQTPTPAVRLEDLKSLIQRSPFPLLPKLERFSFRLHSGTNFESAVFVSIMDVNFHAKELEMEYDSHSTDNLQRVSSSVKTLNLEKLSFSTRHVPNFPEIINPSWALSKIHLRIQPRDTTEDPLKVLSIFEILHNYKETLTHVALDLITSMWWDEQPLELPNVTNFSIRFKIDDREVENSEGLVLFNSIDYLIPMEKLTELKWIYNGPTTPTNDAFECAKECELIKFRCGST